MTSASPYSAPRTRRRSSRPAAGAIDELLASGALDDSSGLHKDDIQTELDRLSGGTDVELELQRMKAELAGGPSAQQQAIEGGTGQSAQQQSQRQDTPRFDKP